jgi:hypothetical protein
MWQFPGLRDLVTRPSNHLASFRMKMDITFMIADSVLESKSWIQSRISEFMRENVSKGVDPVLVVSWTIHGQTDLLKYAHSSNNLI